MATPPPFFFDCSFWQSFVSNLIATLLGVGLGIPAALWISRRQEASTEKEHKKKILYLLCDELQFNKEILTRWDGVENQKEDMWEVTMDLKYEVWTAFSDGGEIEWIKDPILLGKLATVFSDIKGLRNLAEWTAISYNYNESVPQQTREKLLKRMVDKSRACNSLIAETIEVIK